MFGRRCYLLGLGFALALVSGVAQGEEIIGEAGITYVQVGETALKLDLARPPGEGPFPAIVFIHGGGWHSGGRNQLRPWVEEAARRGYVAATISYRLMKYDDLNGPGTPNFPAQVHDAKAAIRWLRAHADKYHVDLDRIGVAGASAGGHLALLVGLTDSAAGLEGEGGYRDQSSRVQAVVNWFGPTEMASCHDKSSVAWMLRMFVGGTPAEAPDRYRAASPTTYVSQDDPPVLTLHGDRDQLVPVEQAHLLDQKMKAAGAPHTLLVLTGQGHGFQGEHQQKAVAAMWAFFEQHLQGK